MYISKPSSYSSLFPSQGLNYQPTGAIGIEMTVIEVDRLTDGEIEIMTVTVTVTVTVIVTATVIVTVTATVVVIVTVIVTMAAIDEGKKEVMKMTLWSGRRKRKTRKEGERKR